METSWGRRSCHLLFPLLLLILLPEIFSATLITTTDANLRCNGSIAECNEEEELLMESEIAGRFLQETQNHISYGALKQNQPVCGGAANGDAYTKTRSCQPPPSNPQNRGCPKYYQCRSGS
ncbi:protein RALF-like 32 [Telopea speciosissima]|uniref:protein RALF-like 32 n=1 Tax=Telopea speciosissima TaxID=54955 RepID=UPI001CC3F784|nr:protein RALF-like 32 [Telopea speciosissima]